MDNKSGNTQKKKKWIITGGDTDPDGKIYIRRRPEKWLPPKKDEKADNLKKSAPAKLKY